MNLKQLLGFKESMQDREGKINELKDKLDKLISVYSYNAYYILNEILTIRRQQIKGYELSKLPKEDGIFLTEEQVRYIFGWKYATPTSIKLIETGKIKASLVLYLIRRGKIFREHKKQDKVIKAILTKKVRIAQVSNIKPARIMQRIRTGNKELGNDEYMIRMCQKLQRFRDELNDGKNMFKDKKMKTRLLKTLHEVQLIALKL